MTTKLKPGDLVVAKEITWLYEPRKETDSRFYDNIRLLHPDVHEPYFVIGVDGDLVINVAKGGIYLLHSHGLFLGLLKSFKAIEDVTNVKQEDHSRTSTL